MKAHCQHAGRMIITCYICYRDNMSNPLTDARKRQLARLGGAKPASDPHTTLGCGRSRIGSIVVD
jgi:hypothetical protein